MCHIFAQERFFTDFLHNGIIKFLLFIFFNADLKNEKYNSIIYIYNISV